MRFSPFLLLSFFLLPSSARHFGTNRKANNASQRCRIRRDLKIDRDPCNVILETLKTGFLRILPCKSSLFVYGAISSSIKRTYLPGVREKNVAEIKRAVKFSTLITTFLNLFSTRGQPRDIERKWGGGNDACIVIFFFFFSNATRRKDPYRITISLASRLLRWSSAFPLSLSIDPSILSLFPSRHVSLRPARNPCV